MRRLRGQAFSDWRKNTMAWLVVAAAAQQERQKGAEKMRQLKLQLREEAYRRQEAWEVAQAAQNAREARLTQELKVAVKRQMETDKWAKGKKAQEATAKTPDFVATPYDKPSLSAPVVPVAPLSKEELRGMAKTSDFTLKPSMGGNKGPRVKVVQPSELKATDLRATASVDSPAAAPAAPKKAPPKKQKPAPAA